MSFRGNLIIEGEHEWRIHAADDYRTLPKASDPAAIVATVKELLANSKSVRSEWIIAPASSSCFFSHLSLPPEIDAKDRRSLIYELENHLPIDAESMAADFSVLPAAAHGAPRLHGRSVAAVAVEVDDWKPLTTKLESADIPVTNIVPSAILAMVSLHEKHSLAGVSSLMLCHGEHADLITLVDDRISSWKYGKIDATSLERHKSLDLPASNQILVVDCTEAQGSLIRNKLGSFQIEPNSFVTHCLEGANTALSKPASIQFNLRRDDLAPEDPLRPMNRQLSWLAFAVATCLIAMIFGSWWRTTRLERKISENLLAQSAAFQESFPDTRVPASLLRRVRSEHSRIMGSRNATKQIEAPNSATEVMHVLLASLPRDIRVRISSIDIRNGDLDLTFQVQHFVEAGLVAEALARGGFDVSQPATAQKDAKTFESTIQARWRQNPSANANQASEGAASSNRVPQGKPSIGEPNTPISNITRSRTETQEADAK